MVTVSPEVEEKIRHLDSLKFQYPPNHPRSRCEVIMKDLPIPKKKTLIIAEAALEHSGDLTTAKKMADAARWAGADIVKFQTFFGTQPTLTQYEFAEREWRSLFRHCDNIGIEWASTPFDYRAIDFLESCGMKTWKIASGFVTHYGMLGRIRMVKRRKTIISNGMASESEMLESFSCLQNNISAVLDCVSLYPCPPSEISLFYMPKMNPSYGAAKGLSDHTEGIWAAPVAVALGATVIEKHFTLDRKNGGPDAVLSVEPHELKEMIQNIRNVEAAMQPGTGKQMENRDAIRERMGC